MRNRKTKKYTLLLLLLLGISLGYALISTTLKITGVANVTKNTWNVYWANPVVTEGSVSTELPVIGNDSGDSENTKVSWTATFDLPGDYYEFTIDAVNAGTIDAMITGIQSKANGNDISMLPSYIKYTITYSDGMELAQNHLLPKKEGNTPTTQKYKIRIEYDAAGVTADTINDMPQGGASYEFTFAVTYAQAKGNTINPKGLIASCPNCEFGMYYQIGDLPFAEGETMPLTLATSNDEVLPNNFEGFTTDYTKLRVATKQYMCEDNYYIIPTSSQKYCTHWGGNVIRTLPDVDRQRVKFYGVELDSNRVIQQVYLCGINDDKPFCLKITSDSSKFAEYSAENKELLKKIYGTYNESTHLGCHEVNYSGEIVYECYGTLNTFLVKHNNWQYLTIGENYILDEYMTEAGKFVGEEYGNLLIAVDSDTGEGTCDNHGCFGI